MKGLRPQLLNFWVPIKLEMTLDGFIMDKKGGGGDWEIIRPWLPWLWAEISPPLLFSSLWLLVVNSLGRGITQVWGKSLQNLLNDIVPRWLDFIKKKAGAEGKRMFMPSEGVDKRQTSFQLLHVNIPLHLQFMILRCQAAAGGGKARRAAWYCKQVEDRKQVLAKLSYHI